MRVALVVVGGVVLALAGLLLVDGAAWSRVGAILLFDLATAFVGWGVLLGPRPPTRARAVLSAAVFGAGAAVSLRVGLTKRGGLESEWSVVFLVQLVFVALALATALAPPSRRPRT